MTVCIAAICHHATTIFAACDRMLTSGDIEFEPDIERLQNPGDGPYPLVHNVNAKISMLTSSIVALTAGDSGLQSEVMNETFNEVNKLLSTPPLRWLGVKEVVTRYLNSYNQIKDKCVGDSILKPLGLDRDTFISRQREMIPEFVLDINKQIRHAEANFMETHGIETIIAGVDEVAPGNYAPHIYVIIKSLNGDYSMCCDSIGFAAVGIGSRHCRITIHARRT